MARTPQRTINKKFQPWFISSGTRLAGDFDSPAASTPTTGRTCHPTLEQVQLQELLQASTEATTDAIYTSSDVEKGAHKLDTITRESWIDFKPRYTTYKHSKGRRTMAQLVNPLKINFCAKYIFDIPPSDFLLMNDAVFTNILDSNFDIEKASDHNKVLSALKMKENNFNRTLIEVYCCEFLDALEKNPNFRDPENGGTTEKLINVIFVSGLKSDLFRQNIERHGTEDTAATYKAIKNLLPKFQESINMGFNLQSVQHSSNHKTPSAEKPPYAEVKHSVNCQNCGEPGHTFRACPFRAECKKCKTKSHAYWSSQSPQCPLFTAWKAKDDAQRAKNGLPPFVKKVYSASGRVAAPPTDPSVDLVAFAAMERALRAQTLEFAEYKAEKEKVKPTIIDSGANVSVISDVTHVDTNTVPLCRRAEDATGVVTASGEELDISGRGIIVGVEGAICLGATASLVSASQVCKERGAYVIMDSCGAIAVSHVN